MANMRRKRRIDKEDLGTRGLRPDDDPCPRASIRGQWGERARSPGDPIASSKASPSPRNDAYPHAFSL
jgi:hypothetical protein